VSGDRGPGRVAASRRFLVLSSLSASPRRAIDSAIHRAARRAEPGGFGNPAGKSGVNPGIHRSLGRDLEVDCRIHPCTGAVAWIHLGGWAVPATRTAPQDGGTGDHAVIPESSRALGGEVSAISASSLRHPATFRQVPGGLPRSPRPGRPATAILRTAAIIRDHQARQPGHVLNRNRLDRITGEAARQPLSHGQPSATRQLSAAHTPTLHASQLGGAVVIRARCPGPVHDLSRAGPRR
jgi:hypothetical protein